jgi:exodeoxyribonuclease V alpha subunit
MSGNTQQQTSENFTLGIWIPPGLTAAASGSAAAEAGTAGPTEMRGRVTRLLYRAEDSDFCIFEVDIAGEDARTVAKGAWLAPRIGAEVELQGSWKPRKGRADELEFVATSISEVTPKDTDGLYLWLRSGAIRGVGDVWARRLVDHFGMDFPRVIDQAPDRLAELKMPERLIEIIKKGWAEVAPQRVLMPFLREIGLGTEMSATVWRHFERAVDGDTGALVKMVRDNPYMLTEVSGIGFAIADQVAGRLGIALHSQARVRAGIDYVLHRQAADGHVWIEHERLVTNVGRLLGRGVSEETINATLSAVEAEGKAAPFRSKMVGGREAWAEARACQVEEELAASIRAVAGPAKPLEVIQPEDFTLDPSQLEALEAISASRLAVLTGGPGMGKTTLIAQLLASAAKAGLSTSLCAPTGRAAKRMSEATDHEAKTIHRMMIYYDDEGAPRWHDKSNPLPAQLVIVDETSMTDQYIAAKFFDAIGPDTRVLLVGDVNQLPSVGQGRVLEDIIASGIVPVGRLTKIHRQGAGSSIPVIAQSILDGKVPQFCGQPDVPVLNLVKLRERLDETLDREGVTGKARKDELDRRLTAEAVRCVTIESKRQGSRLQVLAPMHKGPFGTVALNAALRERFNPDVGQPQLRDGSFRVGDQVIHLVNNYEKGVFNGELGRVSGVSQAKDGEEILHVDFEEASGTRTVLYEGSGEQRQLDHSYCLTFHKGQGAQFPGIAVFADTSHYNMLTRNLVYTGLTRAEKHALFATSTRALQMTCDKERMTPRRTALAELVSGVQAPRQASSSGSEQLAPEDWEIGLMAGEGAEPEAPEAATGAAIPWSIFTKPSAPKPVTVATHAGEAAPEAPEAATRATIPWSMFAKPIAPTPTTVATHAGEAAAAAPEDPPADEKEGEDDEDAQLVMGMG